MNGIRTAGLIAAFSLVGIAGASSLTVDSQDNIYGAGQVSAPGGGNVPTAAETISLDSSAQYLTFSDVTGSITCVSPAGCITLDGGTDNDPDGIHAASGSSNTGSGSLSGITAPGAGYLVGVFIDGTPSGPAPTALDFNVTDFTSLSPELDQVFFIGDGLVGDGTGAQQIFYVPTGATELVLGISDAGGYNGSPGSYGDNAGTYSLNYDVTGSAAATPEPASMILLGGGLALAGLLRRRSKA